MAGERYSSSEELFKEALQVFPGGVNSPIRAAVKPYPFFVKEARGARIVTVEGRELVDWVMGYGPLILGHGNERVKREVVKQIERGWLYGAPSRVELELAKKILGYYGPGKIRFVNSGTEATLTAVRLARAYTGRDRLVKFEGCYHGSNDSLLVKSGSAASHMGLPATPGVPGELAELTYVLPYNDLDAFNRLMRDEGNKVAAVIVEPVAANMGVVEPSQDFLKALREETEREGALLVFDEVVTGFRLGLRGAQGLYGIRPDITVLGKIIGGGFPIGAVVGDREVMDNLAPSGPAFNAGTFNAHPVAMAAGLATINVLEEGWPYRKAESAAELLEEGLGEIFKDATINRVGSMLQIFFARGPVRTYSDVLKADRLLYEKLHEKALKRGVFIPPSQFETWFASSAHGEEEVSLTLEALRQG